MLQMVLHLSALAPFGVQRAQLQNCKTIDDSEVSVYYRSISVVFRSATPYCLRACRVGRATGNSKQ